MSNHARLTRIIARLSEAPMETLTVDPTIPSADPVNQSLSTAALSLFSHEVESGENPKCLLCDVTWSADIASNPVRPGGLAIITRAREFRCDADEEIPMIASGVCENCIADKSTPLSARIFDRYKLIWPQLFSIDTKRINPGNDTKN